MAACTRRLDGAAVAAGLVACVELLSSPAWDLLASIVVSMPGDYADSALAVFATHDMICTCEMMLF